MTTTTTHTSQTVPAIVADLTRRGVGLAVTADGGLVVDAPAGTLGSADLAVLRALKADIVRHLIHSGVPAPATPESAADDIDDATTCTGPGCTAVVDAYDEHEWSWCAAHRPDPGPIAPAPEPPPWHCACGSHVSGLLPRCPTCLRQPGGTPSPCVACGAPVVRRPPPPRDPSLRTSWGEEPPSTGPGLEVFCPRHRRGAHVLHLAAARGWPAFATSDGTTIGEGKAAWLRTVREHPDSAWCVRVLVELGSIPPAPKGCATEPLHEGAER